jgi:hypothetical protein
MKEKGGYRKKKEMREQKRYIKNKKKIEKRERD